MQSAFLLSEDQAIVELAVDIPFGIRGREIRVVPAAWAAKIAQEFRTLGEPAPDDLHPLSPTSEPTEHEFLESGA